MTTLGRARKLRTRIAWLVTVAWLCLVAWWTFCSPCGVLCIPQMHPNEWGDWAAGAFAPLAFLWLVVGYFQQGEELRDNVRALHLQEEALRLQAQELKESVQQQTAAAKAASRQADMLEKSQKIALRSQVLQHQPRFTNFFLRGRNNSDDKLLKVSAANVGRLCYDIVVEYKEEDETKVTMAVGDLWGSDTELTFNVGPPPRDTSIVTLTLRYTDELLVRQSQAFRLVLGSSRATEGALKASLDHMTFKLPVSLDDLVSSR